MVCLAGSNWSQRQSYAELFAFTTSESHDDKYVKWPMCFLYSSNKSNLKMQQSDCVVFVRAVNVTLIHKALLRGAMFNVAFKYYYKLIFSFAVILLQKTLILG